ncbi:helix-turn-helix domain-containing protein [uncultured Maricaulis sp.]|uniref:helix-turn-helix domain-containing protein n=1 Tax=uncultured Maricaulis sp. TaxID=174710 RepID=UPI0030DD9DF0
MSEIAVALKLVVSAAAVASIFVILGRRQFSGLLLAWAIFSAGLAATMLSDVIGGIPAPLAASLAIAACASCSCFWLVSRGLFRVDVGFGWPQAILVGGIFAPAIIKQALIALPADQLLGEASLSGIIAALLGFQTMLSSTVLVLAFWEGVRGWSAGLSRPEQRFRLGYLATFGCGVAICVMLLDHGNSTRIDPALMSLLQASCAAAIFLVAGLGVIWRTRTPLIAEAPVEAALSAPATTEERAMGRWLRQRVETEQLYLDPELKVASLARRLREPDYRISRAITAGLGERNFNRFINRYRIEHAKTLLRDRTRRESSILDIALDSGFASIGPFNRAFKDSEGVTPRVYRGSPSPAGARNTGQTAPDVLTH